MRKIILFLTLLGSAAGVNAQEKKTETITFKGSADTIYNGNSVVMYTPEKVDSVKVIGGKFNITVPYTGPGRYMFYSKYELKKKHGYSPYGILVAKPGVIDFKVDMESMAKSVVSNAPDNELYFSFSKGTGAARQKVMDKLNEQYGAETIKNLKETDANYKTIVATYNELTAASTIQEAARLENFIKANPKSFAPMYALYGMSGSLPADQMQSFYNQLSDNYKSSVWAKDIVKKIESIKITALGKIAPDFEQPDTAGKMVRLSALRGQYVLVDFWASWCGPCRAENPNVVKAYQQYHDKGFTVLGVSLDQPGKKEAWLKAIHQDHLTWTHVSDLQFWNNAVAKLYGIQAIPQNYLLDKTGKIIAINIKGEELTGKLKEIFQN